MPHLRRSALAGLLLAVVPATALSACGFDYPTDRVNTIAAGVNDRSEDVDALGIRILATATGEGRLIGTLANNTREAASLDAVTSSAGITAGDFEPVEVPARGMVNLADAAPVPLTGDFTAGDFVPLDLAFSDGSTVSLDVPVVKRCFQYTEVPTDAAAASTPSGKAGAGEESTAKHAEDAEQGATESTEEGAEEGAGHAEESAGHAEEGGDTTFTCADEIPTPGSGSAH